MLKINSITILFLIFSQNSFADSELVLDHNDPEIRQKILNTARYVRDPIDKYKYFRMGIDNWQRNEAKKDDLESACTGLAANLYRSKNLTKKKQLLKGCPDAIHQKWLGTADRDYSPLIKVAPIYPAYAERSKLEGWATTIYDVDTKGRPKNIRIKESSSKYFHKSALKATKKFLYLPARKDSKLIESKGVTNKFYFKLN